MQLISTTTPVLRDEVFTTEEQTALGGFLAGYAMSPRAREPIGSYGAARPVGVSSVSAADGTVSR